MRLSQVLDSIFYIRACLLVCLFVGMFAIRKFVSLCLLHSHTPFVVALAVVGDLRR